MNVVTTHRDERRLVELRLTELHARGALVVLVSEGAGAPYVVRMRWAKTGKRPRACGRAARAYSCAIELCWALRAIGLDWRRAYGRHELESEVMS